MNNQVHHPTGPTARDQRLAVLARWPLCLFVIAQVISQPGCKPNKRYDLIEAELRTRDRELADTRCALEQARNLNRAYAQQAKGVEPPPPNAPIYMPVREITLGRGTGAVSSDDRSDDGLMVVVVPRDEDGAAVKVPASLDIVACDINPAGLKTPIGNWTVPADKVRPTWRSGFLSTGYFVVVPWQTRACSEHVRVTVKLTTLDGRVFETDKDIYVKAGPWTPVPPSDVQQNPVGPAPAPAPVLAPAPTPVSPPSRGREPLLPDPLPPGTEELPPPSAAPERGAKLQPPERPNPGP